MAKLFLIDAYALIYRSYYAFIKSPRINSKGLNTSAVMGFCNTLNEVLTKEKPTHIGVAFDHGKTFRHDAFPEYKAQREETPEDIKLSVPLIKQVLEAMHIPILQVDGFEADDIIGTVATRFGADGIETFMLTPDKDYGQLIGPKRLYVSSSSWWRLRDIGRKGGRRKVWHPYPSPSHRPIGIDGRLSR